MNRKLGEMLTNQYIPPLPDNLELKGLHVSLTSTSSNYHMEKLYEEYSKDLNASIWDYMKDGPFSNKQIFKEWLESIESKKDPYYLTIFRIEDDTPCGLASYMRIKPQDRCIEVGNISYSPSLQNSIHATEAMYLMMDWAFSNGYRRYEWKCNSLNKKSRKAAQRLGFNFEGIFLQHMIVKGRNRDTAWFSIIDKNWFDLKKCFETYLNAKNFDMNGNQKDSLSRLTKKLITKVDPSLQTVV